MDNRCSEFKTFAAFNILWLTIDRIVNSLFGRPCQNAIVVCYDAYTPVTQIFRERCGLCIHSLLGTHSCTYAPLCKAWQNGVCMNSDPEIHVNDCSSQSCSIRTRIQRPMSGTVVDRMSARVRLGHLRSRPCRSPCHHGRRLQGLGAQPEVAPHSESEGLGIMGQSASLWSFFRLGGNLSGASRNLLEENPPSTPVVCCLAAALRCMQRQAHTIFIVHLHSRMQTGICDRSEWPLSYPFPPPPPLS